MLEKTHKLELVGKTQNDRIKYWFDRIKPTITPLEALQHLGIFRLASRINELKSEMKINASKVKVMNQFGEECYVCEYKKI